MQFQKEGKKNQQSNKTIKNNQDEDNHQKIHNTNHDKQQHNKKQIID